MKYLSTTKSYKRVEWIGWNEFKRYEDIIEEKFYCLVAIPRKIF